MKLYATILALALVASTALGQWSADPPTPNTITIGAPSVPIAPGPSVQLSVAGLTDDELKNVVLSVNPAVGAIVLKTRDWDGRATLTFGAVVPGKYTVTLTLFPDNEWRVGASDALLRARDVRMGPELLAKFDANNAAFVKELETKFPFKRGAAVVEVAGVVPFPPGPTPTPIPPGPVTEGKRNIVILREAGEAPPELARLITAIRTGPVTQRKKEKGHNLAILDDDLPESQQWVALLAGVKMPAVIITDPKVSGSSAVLFRGELPATDAALLELIKTYGG